MKKLAMLALAATLLASPAVADTVLTNDEMDRVAAGADGVQPLSFLVANIGALAQAYWNPGVVQASGWKFLHVTKNGQFLVFTRVGATGSPYMLFSPNAFNNAINNQAN